MFKIMMKMIVIIRSGEVNDEGSESSGKAGGESLWPVTMLIFVCVYCSMATSS